MDKKKRNTIIFLAIVVAAALAGIAAQQTFLKESGAYAVVQVDGEEAARPDLAKDTVFTVGDGETDYNIIEIRDGYASVTEADCEDLICVRTGKVQNKGDVIACLPHKLIVYIVREDEQGADVDVTAGG